MTEEVVTKLLHLFNLTGEGEIILGRHSMFYVVVITCSIVVLTRVADTIVTISLVTISHVACLYRMSQTKSA